MSTSEKSSKSKAIPVMAILLVLSLGLNGILFLKRADVFPSKKELIEANEKLDQKLSQSRSELNKYQGISERIDKVISDAQEKIAESERQMASLRRDKKRLLAENDELIFQVDSLKESYLTVIDSLLVEQDRKHVLNMKIESLEEEVTRLNKRIGIASWLVADDLTVIPKKTTIMGNLSQTALARKVEEMEICLDIQQNRVAKPGTKKYYVIITSPDGRILTEEEGDPPVFMHPEYDKQARYSKSGEFNYQNQKLEICSILAPKGNLISGLYVVEVFTEENKLAMTTFSLK